MLRRKLCYSLVFPVTCCCIIVYIPILLSIKPLAMEPWNVTRDMTILIRPNSNTAIIGAKSFCTLRSNQQVKQEEEEEIFLLVVVSTSVENIKARQAIRETWGSKESLNSAPRQFSDETADNLPLTGIWIPSAHPVRLIFMLGYSGDATQQEMLLAENIRYNDIIQEDFHDTYNNLTLKSVMMLKWINSSCQNARYIMKIDDDTFVNVPRLVLHLLNHGNSHLLMGGLICGGVPVKFKHLKWYAPRVLYKERFYPGFLSGTGYVMSNQLVPLLYQTALATPFFNLEDVFITGICAKQLKVTLTDHKGFAFKYRITDPCHLHFGISGHFMMAENTRDMWKAMWDPHLRCDSKYTYNKLTLFRPSKCFF